MRIYYLTVDTSSMKKVLLLALIVLIAFTGWKVYERITSPVNQGGFQRNRPQVPVEITAVKRSTVRDIGKFTGSLKPKSRFIVSPKITGRLEEIYVHIGDSLKPNQLVATLDDEESQQRLIQANAQLEVARANLEASYDSYDYAAKELERIESLRKRKLVSESDLDTVKAKFKEQNSKIQSARAQLKEKEAAVQVAKIQLSYTEMRIVWNEPGGDLVVGERFMDEGALITTNGQLISVLDISALIAQISVPERDYFKCHLGQLVTIEADALKGETFSGRIKRVAPLIKESSREALIEIEISNKAKKLRPGLFVRASIQFETRTDVIVIPQNALVKRDEMEGVFLADLDSLTVRFMPVETGISENSIVEITNPAIDGYVVTLGHHLLEDGSSISIPDQSPDQSSPQKSVAGPKRHASYR